MKKLVFATNNPHKLEEVRAILQEKFESGRAGRYGCAQLSFLKPAPPSKPMLPSNHTLWSITTNQTALRMIPAFEVDALDGQPRGVLGPICR